MASSEKRQLQDFINSTLTLSEDFAKFIRAETGHMWTSSKQRKRIIKAISSCCPVISEKIQSVGRMNAESCFVNAAGMYSDTPEQLEKETYLSTAAALWLRDQMEETQEGTACLWETAYDADLQSMDTDLPPINDPARPVGVNETLEKIVANRLTEDHYLYENYSPSRYGPTDALYRRILELIDPAIIEKAETVFLDRFMAYLETAMKITKIYILEMDRTLEKISEKIPQPKTALTMDPSIDIMDMLEENQEFRERVDPAVEMQFMINNLPHLMLGRTYLFDGTQYQDKVIKIAEEFDPLHTSDGEDVDPFTMAFGYCRMMDKNDDFIFLLGVSVPMMRIYAYLFPWSGSYCAKQRDTFLPAWCEKSSNIYARRVWDKAPGNTKKNSIGAYCSLAQLVYDQAKIVLTMSAAESIDFWVEKRKLTNNDIRLMADTITMLDDEMSMTQEIYNELGFIMEEEKPEEDEPEEPEEEAEETISEREIQLQNQLKEAHDLLKASEHGRVTAEKEIRKIKENTEDQRRELFDLRELIYQSLSENEPEEENVAEKDNELLPCTVKKRTVVFGGHDSWRKAIKEMLAGVTFAPNKKLVNADLVRHADVVWVQVNSMPHAAYYAICDYAKTHNIPIRYFTFNSATACAIQLAKADAE